MFSLKKREVKTRAMALADIRSDGIQLAIIKSESDAPYPEIVWSYFEAFPRGHLERENEKVLQAAVRSAVSKLELEGIRFLHKNFPNLTPELFKVTVSAPLSETVARGVKFHSKTPIELNTDLVDEVSRRAPIPANDSISKTLESRFGLTQTAGEVGRFGQNGLQFVSILPTSVFGEIKSGHERFLNKAKLVIEPRIGDYARALSDLPHDTNQMCLIDLSGSATELCVVCDGAVKNVSHTEGGTNKIIKSLAHSLNLPESEVAHLFKDNDVNVLKSLSQDRQAILESTLKEYEDSLKSLLKRNTDDTLPTTIFVHGDNEDLNFIRDRLNALDIWPSSPDIHQITPNLWNSDPTLDTPLVVTAILFHKKRQ